MLLESFKITGSGVGQILLLGGLGYFLLKRNILSGEGLSSISRIVIEITLPALMFCQLVKDFSFTKYPDWWVFPLISIAITIAGLGLGALFMGFIRGTKQKLQFINLIAFQNSGYLPLALLAALLPADKIGEMFIYLFLFLLGFNLIMWSFGVYMLTFTRTKKFELGSLFSPPVIATLAGLAVIFLGWDRFLPGLVMKPLRLVGDCTLPLAMIVVGANIAEVKVGRIDKKAMALVLLAKLVILPALGLFLMLKFAVPELFGLLVIIQLAMPSATSLSVITSHYKQEDLLISQGIFYSHIVSIVTIPVFLSLYLARVMIQ